MLLYITPANACFLIARQVNNCTALLALAINILVVSRSLENPRRNLLFLKRRRSFYYSPFLLLGSIVAATKVFWYLK